MKETKKRNLKLDLTKAKFNALELLLIFIMALVFGLLIGEMIFQNGKTANALTEKTNSNMNEIKNVYDTLLNEYINQIEENDLKEAAIKGMLNLLGDQHSIYYNEEESEEFKDELNGYFYGMGAEISQKKGQLVTIEKVYKNSPAEKAGLKKGDKYIKINGKDVTNLTSYEIASQIKGKISKKLTITIKRANEEKKVVVFTDKIEIPSVTKTIIKKGNQKIGYLKISIFASNTDEQFEKALKKLEKENINKIIIDLRYNKGGQLETVINMASQFLNKKTPIITIINKDKKDIKYSTKNINNKSKMVILINGGSASGSEVFAAALNEQLGTELIGTTTYGKGTVQKTKTLSSGGLVKYTTETWKTSKEKDIDKKGLKPTIEIEQSEKYYKTYKTEDDIQLKKAIEVISNK